MDGKTIIVKYGEDGSYIPTEELRNRDPKELNKEYGIHVDEEIERMMRLGSMYGWDIPGIKKWKNANSMNKKPIGPRVTISTGSTFDEDKLERVPCFYVDVNGVYSVQLDKDLKFLGADDVHTGEWIYYAMSEKNEFINDHRQIYDAARTELKRYLSKSSRTKKPRTIRRK